MSGFFSNNVRDPRIPGSQFLETLESWIVFEKTAKSQKSKVMDKISSLSNFPTRVGTLAAGQFWPRDEMSRLFEPMKRRETPDHVNRERVSGNTKILVINEGVVEMILLLVRERCSLVSALRPA